MEKKKFDQNAYMREYRKSDKYKAYLKAYQKSDKYKAYQKSDKYKAYLKAYQKSDKYKASQKAYQKSDKYKASQKAYQKSDKYKASQKAYQKSDKFKASLKERNQIKSLKEFYISKIKKTEKELRKYHIPPIALEGKLIMDKEIVANLDIIKNYTTNLDKKIKQKTIQTMVQNLLEQEGILVSRRRQLTARLLPSINAKVSDEVE